MPVPLPTIASRVMTTPGFTFPRTIEKLESLFADPAVPGEVVQAVISSDPILTAVTLSQANLAGEGVTRLSEALRTVGLGGVIGITRGFLQIPPVCTKHLAACWQQANACAIMTPLVAKVAATHAPSLEVSQMDDQTLATAGLLQESGVRAAVINARFLRPLDQALIAPMARRIGRVVTMEEGALAGGFGAAVVEALNDLDVLVPVLRIGIPDVLVDHASPDQSKQSLGLTPPQMAQRILERYGASLQRQPVAV